MTVTGPNGQPQLASMSDRKLSMRSTTLAPLVALLVVSRVVGQNVANLHFCPGHKKKFAFLSQKNDLPSRLVLNGGVFCPGTERVGQTLNAFFFPLRANNNLKTDARRHFQMNKS